MWGKMGQELRKNGEGWRASRVCRASTIPGAGAEAAAAAVGSSVGYSRMTRGTKADGDLVRAFAAAHGVAVRTARNYRKEKRPEWVEFVKGCAGKSVPDVAANDLERARVTASTAYDTLRRLQGMQAACTEPAVLAALQRGVSDALRAWQRARTDCEQLAQRAGRVVPVENVRRIQSLLVSELGQVFRSAPNMAAAHLLPAARSAHFAAWKKVLPSLETVLKKIDAEIEALLVC